ncbi:NAD(P)H-dependent oxidoreductase subunit E [Treponema brennaborense]|uniref:NADH dehydrogenase (Ubiquinone) 24 kDa subunit n=1 Tax=Treponema brennaborense (strain DSM 12168 / CIP 105900 / DD5/3) TaxID=906968 RepID=F4LLS9_TREBD|nr:NAD(P)H-dependent oxidoreductase subunit E [Treponema brennaborense]AEE17723.1 hypothetical protein Trebr_2314 [Treponema brennaborense DSM 12168]
MNKIHVSICTGTACFVMGASEIMLLEEQLPPELQGRVEIEGITCFDKCKNAECGKAPFVQINGETIPEASLVTVIDRIRELAGA